MTALQGSGPGGAASELQMISQIEASVPRTAVGVNAPPLVDDLLDTVRRRRLLEQHGRVYGQMKLTIGFTIGIGLGADGTEFKKSTSWMNEGPLATADQGAAYVAGRGMQRNPVLVLGPSNLIGVDIDGEEGRARLRDLVPQGLPPTVCVRTGGGGWHLWFRPPPAPTKVVKVEFSAKQPKLTHSNGYLVAPPAFHAATGKLYRFAEGYEPWSRPIATFPAELLDQLEGDRRRSKDEARTDDAGPITAGDRHDHLLSLAGLMRYGGCGERTILAALLTENEARCTPPKTEYEVRDLAADVCRRYAPGARS